MAYKLRTEIGKAIYCLRKCTVEPVIGIIKAVLGFRQFLLRGLQSAGGEWCLVCLAPCHGITAPSARQEWLKGAKKPPAEPATRGRHPLSRRGVRRSGWLRHCKCRFRALQHGHMGTSHCLSDRLLDKRRRVYLYWTHGTNSAEGNCEGDYVGGRPNQHNPP